MTDRAPSMTNVRVVPSPVFVGGEFRDATNALYDLDGRPASARLNWRAGVVDATNWLNAIRGDR